MGKQGDGPLTRSRIASGDLNIEDEFSYVTSLQDIKKTKKRKLNLLKNNDMFLMSACDEDSALSVQNHIIRKYRKRKAIPLRND